MPSRPSFIPNQVTLALIAIVVLIIAFVSGWTMTFYASFLFLFYSWTGKMWVSVILLGVFQTILLIPFRIISIRKANDIKSVINEVEEIENSEKKITTFRNYFSSGNRPTLFYSVTFYIQLVSFASIGRLFLTDFYSVPISPDHLLPFAPYPHYPIHDVFFTVPYPFPIETLDSGMIAFIILAGLIIGAKYAIQKTFADMYKKLGHAELAEVKMNGILKSYLNMFAENSVVLLLIAWIVTRALPIGWEIRYFVNDITVPNRSLNTFTALLTFGTVIWLNRNQIQSQYEALVQAGMKRLHAEKQRTQLWRETLFNATLIGLAAFFMTNQIPSAFELSVFTLEIISMLSPFTLDKLIKKGAVKKED